MNNSKKTAAIVLRIVAVIVLVFGGFFGAIFFGVGVFTQRACDEVEERLDELTEDSYDVTQGVIMDTENGSTISYSVDGEHYVLHLNSSSSEYYQGRRVDIYYQTTAPQYAMAPTMEEDIYKLVSFIFKLVGGIFIGIAVTISIVLFVVSFVMNKKSANNAQSYSSQPSYNLNGMNQPQNSYNLNGMNDYDSFK